MYTPFQHDRNQIRVDREQRSFVAPGRINPESPVERFRRFPSFPMIHVPRPIST